GEGGFSAPAVRETAQAELGVLNLSRGQFVQALDLLVKAKRPIDAAYVAEQGLTTNELKDYVKTHEGSGLEEGVGRRLARDGRYAVARTYLPSETARRVDELAAKIEEGRDPRQSKEKRAAALMAAARVARFYGEDVLATEVEPDWRALGLNFELG